MSARSALWYPVGIPVRHAHCLALTTLLALLAMSPYARAQAITLGPGFSPDPQVLQGYSGGNASASWITRGCPGFIPAVAQHRLTLPGGIAFLRIWAHSEGDATLLVHAPDGTVFCDDDTWNHDPGVDIQAAIPGAYDIYVGTYRAGESRPYSLGFTASPASEPPRGAVTDPPAPTPPGVEPPVPIALVPGFAPDPGYLAGVAGGSVDAHALGEGCAGFVGSVPSQVFTVTAPMERLRLWAHAHGDTTLVVRTPGGRTLCADDNYDKDPMLEILHLPPGDYQVFVGARTAATPIAYALGLSERATATPAMLGDWMSPGGAVPLRAGAMASAGSIGSSDGVLAVTPGGGPLQSRGSSGGPSEALALGHGCSGYISAQPNHVLHVSATLPFLRVYVTAPADTTLVVVGPSGEPHCADDTYHANPGVDLRRVSPGDYRIFVGSYDPGARTDYELTVTQSQAQHP